MVQADKEDVEDLGLLKLDVLGVRMQSAMAYAVAEIRRTTGRVLDLDNPDHVSLNDQQAFEMIRPRTPSASSSSILCQVLACCPSDPMGGGHHCGGFSQRDHFGPPGLASRSLCQADRSESGAVAAQLLAEARHRLGRPCTRIEREIAAVTEDVDPLGLAPRRQPHLPGPRNLGPDPGRGLGPDQQDGEDARNRTCHNRHFAARRPNVLSSPDAADCTAATSAGPSTSLPSSPSPQRLSAIAD
jgi:hypothetical protein